MYLTCQESIVQNDNFLEKCKTLAGAGYTGIDLMGANLKGAIPEIKKALKETGLEAPTVYSQLGTGTRGPLLDSRSAVRAEDLDVLKQRVECAAEVGANYVIFVPKRSKTLKDKAAKWVLVTMMNEITEWANDYPVTLVLEPLNKQETDFIFDPRLGAQIVETVNHPRLKTMVDTYHMDLESQDAQTMVQAIYPHLSLVHLSDTERALPGEGKVNFKHVLKSLKEINFNRPIGLEGRPASAEALKRCADFLRGIWRDVS